MMVGNVNTKFYIVSTLTVVVATLSVKVVGYLLLCIEEIFISLDEHGGSKASQGKWCLHSARRLTLIDICMTFRENSLNSSEFKERTQLRHNFVTDKFPLK